MPEFPEKSTEYVENPDHDFDQDGQTENQRDFPVHVGNFTTDQFDDLLLRRGYNGRSNGQHYLFEGMTN